MTTWLEVPREIWERIIGLLDVLDVLRIKAVCSRFQSIATDQKKSYLLSRTLLFGVTDSHTHYLSSLADKSTYEIHCSELEDKRCLGSSYGWLVTTDFFAGDISLVNPINGAKISLPPLSSFTDPHGVSETDQQRDALYLIKATITPDPSKAKGFIVMVIFTSKRALAFCRPADTKWTTLAKEGGNFEDVICHKGKFYAIDNREKLVSWDHCDVKASLRIIIPRQSEEGMMSCWRFLVDSPSAGLLKVRMKMKWHDSYHNAPQFSVFKLDKKRKRWIRLESLGDDNALFLGYNCAICVSTLECQEF